MVEPVTSQSKYTRITLARVQSAEDRYKRLGATIALATRGSTPGERDAALAAVRRVLASFPPEEVAILQTSVAGAIPNLEDLLGLKVKVNINTRPPVKRRAGTKRQQIIELLNQGFSPQQVAYKLGMRPNYVYHVKAEMKYESN
jgi:DNA-binding NarL/FixJ family response regulator